MTYSPAQTTTLLRGLGFRVRSTGELTQAIRTYQGGYNLGAWLKEDGINGPATSAALARSEANRRAGRGTASAHFSFREFRCTCGGAYPGCRVVLVRRELLQSLEKYRVRVGAVAIASGYRCPSRNRAVGGASSSQHMYGVAVDISYAMSATGVRALRAFAGIGRSGSTGKVRHVDRRDVSGHNNGGTVTNPMQWIYST